MSAAGLWGDFMLGVGLKAKIAGKQTLMGVPAALQLSGLCNVFKQTEWMVALPRGGGPIPQAQRVQGIGVFKCTTQISHLLSPGPFFTDQSPDLDRADPPRLREFSPP